MKYRAPTDRGVGAPKDYPIRGESVNRVWGAKKPHWLGGAGSRAPGERPCSKLVQAPIDLPPAASVDEKLGEDHSAAKARFPPCLR